MQDDTRTVRLPGNWQQIIDDAIEALRPATDTKDKTRSQRELQLLTKCITNREDLPRSMQSAPRDGTVILAFIDGTDYGQPVRFGKARGWAGRSKPEAWRMPWDDYVLRETDLLGWLPIPTYTGGRVK